MSTARRPRSTRKPKSTHRKPGPAPTGKTPARMLGRISDADWQEMRLAAESAGQKFTQWAKKILLENARKQAKNRDSEKNSGIQ